MRRAWIILALTVATGVAAIQPCRRLVLKQGYRNPHKLSKNRVAAIVAWNSEHPEWVKQWREQHIVKETEILLCPEPTLDQELTELLPQEEPPVTFTQSGYSGPDMMVDEMPTIPAENNDLLQSVEFTDKLISSIPMFGAIVSRVIDLTAVPIAKNVPSAATPEARTWVLMVLGIIVGFSYIKTFRRMR